VPSRGGAPRRAIPRTAFRQELEDACTPTLALHDLRSFLAAVLPAQQSAQALHTVALQLDRRHREEVQGAHDERLEEIGVRVRLEGTHGCSKARSHELVRRTLKAVDQILLRDFAGEHRHIQGLERETRRAARAQIRRRRSLPRNLGTVRLEVDHVGG